jgi:hypothetical protein
VARSFIVYQGEDETPEFDLTDPESNVHVKFEEIEAGGKAFRGESTTNSIPIRDQSGETGNELNLPGGLTHVSLSRGSRWEWLDGPDGAEVRMAAGRIGTKDYTRGVQKADRAREVVMQCGDRNEELQDIIVDAWDRPEETDVVRVNALITAYLSGTPRATTNISNTYVSSDGPVTLPARLYDGTNPRSILQEIAQFANKEFFVTIDDELWYDVATSDSYLAGLRISDRPEEWTTEESGPGAATVRLYPSDIQSGDGPDPESDDAPILIASSHADAAWDDDTAYHYMYMFDSPDSSASGATPGSWAVVNGAVQDVAMNGFVHLLDGDLLSVIQNGGVVRGQHRMKSRHGIGVSEASQLNYANFCVRVYRPGTGFVATLVNVGDVVGTVRFDPVTNGRNSSFGPATFAGYPSAVEGDYVVVDVGTHHTAPTSGATGAGIFTTDTSGSDLPIDDTSTSNFNSWWQFGPPEESLPVFGPRWDVGPASSEDGLELVSGLRLYYGQQGDYVHVTDPTTEAEYWHAERSFYTSDEGIDDATKATVLAEAILQRLKFEDRTYNVSVGPLYEEHVHLLKPGQLVDIKARAIPDADDQFVSRRIAQLKWTTPRPRVFWARMQLDRPLKEAPYGVGPKQAAEEIVKHTTASSSHTASQVTIIDADGNFTATDVEAALDELFDAIGGPAADLPWVNVLDYGADPTGVADSWQAFDDALETRTERSAAIIVPPGVYRMSAPLVLGNSTVIFGVGSNMEEQASGMSTLTYQPHSVLYFDNNTHGIIAPDDAAVTYRCHHPVLENITVRGGGLAQGKTGIWFRDNASSAVAIQRVGLGEIRNCYVEYWGTGIDFDATSDSCNVLGGHIHDCDIGFTGGSSETTIDRVVFWDLATGPAIELTEDRALVTACEIQPLVGGGILVSGDFNRILGNDISDVTGTGISVTGANNTVSTNTAGRNNATPYADSGADNVWGLNNPPSDWDVGSFTLTADAVQAVGRWEPVTNGVDTFVWDGDEIVVTFVETP